MKNFNGINIDPEVLELMQEMSYTPFNNQNESIQERDNFTKTDEVAVKTSSLDSQGNILNVGDKVLVGNDKAVGRIIALGKYAKVNLVGEGEFEFPCSILTLATNSTVETYLQPVITEAKIQQNNINTNQDKFKGYSVESLMRTHDKSEDTFEDIGESLKRLEEMNEGQPFDMGIN